MDNLENKFENNNYKQEISSEKIRNVRSLINKILLKLYVVSAGIIASYPAFIPVEGVPNKYKKGNDTNTLDIVLNKDIKALLFPLSLQTENREPFNQDTSFHILQKYSQLFNEGKALRPEDYENMVDQMVKELERQFQEVLVAYNWNKEDYKKTDSVPNIQLKTLRVHGSASPEGHASRGSNTLIENNIDEENIKLANIRANMAMNIVKDALQRMNINVENVELSSDAREIQFTATEYDWLAHRADMLEYHGENKVEKIYLMIVDYNDGKITDVSSLQVLNTIVGSKRLVEIEVEFAGEHKIIRLIPILNPIFLLLPFLRLKKRKKDEENSGEEDNIHNTPIVNNDHNIVIKDHSEDKNDHVIVVSSVEIFQYRNAIQKNTNGKSHYSVPKRSKVNGHNRKQPRLTRSDYYSSGGSKNSDRKGRKE